ncbi:alpha-glutamyl/putrescinyl thymine pyrophosphorylase clade 3 protein [Rhodococcoides yunnanense]|uniref:Alpha-glutamyl/putrescinyl thymine pyrophosphorylase clade 3 domain-containing protein n=1 Tax=Rhodococcoides yunnanense TaxID=278209 RepID=A0ABU4BIH6_9NOCA|nr:hypothetical protein [Rhodococcus yunnanensis]MDV6263891.1 hypothetical protein [Rhodococcus yunnanensis]
MVLRPVVRPIDALEADRLEDAIHRYTAKTRPLPGISDPDSALAFLGQLIESGHRRRYAERQSARLASARVLDASSGAFDPIMAAVRESKLGNFDNACWLVFLSVHFGRPRQTQWSLVSEFYSKLGQSGVWDWRAVQSDVGAVRTWLVSNNAELHTRGGKFGNHRKYESLNGVSAGGTGEVIESYVDWVGGTHQHRFASIVGPTSARKAAFGLLYESMQAVARFGRTARFDYLTMLGKLALLDIEPDKAYFESKAGPTKGAKLLFSGSADASISNKDLEVWTAQLCAELRLTFDVLEDALCNWQKSPSKFTSFRG